MASLYPKNEPKRYPLGEWEAVAPYLKQDQVEVVRRLFPGDPSRPRVRAPNRPRLARLLHRYLSGDAPGHRMVNDATWVSFEFLMARFGHHAGPLKEAFFRRVGEREGRFVVGVQCEAVVLDLRHSPELERVLGRLAYQDAQWVEEVYAADRIGELEAELVDKLKVAPDEHAAKIALNLFWLRKLRVLGVVREGELLVRVPYSRASRADGRPRRTGRRNGAGVTSAKLSKAIRLRVHPASHLFLDIRAALPSILHGVAVHHGENLMVLSGCAATPDLARETVSRELAISKDTAKRCITAVCFGGHHGAIRKVLVEEHEEGVGKYWCPLLGGLRKDVGKLATVTTPVGSHFHTLAKMRADLENANEATIPASERTWRASIEMRAQALFAQALEDLVLQAMEYALDAFWRVTALIRDEVVIEVDHEHREGDLQIARALARDVRELTWAGGEFDPAAMPGGEVLDGFDGFQIALSTERSTTAPLPAGWPQK